MLKTAALPPMANATETMATAVTIQPFLRVRIA